jgi:hypothetical protein
MRHITFSLLFLPPVLYAVLAIAVIASGRAATSAGWMEFLGFGAWFSLMAYFFMGFIAVPLLLLCAWRQWLGLWQAVAAGCLTGFVALGWPAISQLFDERLHLQYRLGQLLGTYEAVLLGAFAGLLFWLMALWRNPQVANLGRVSKAHTPSEQSAA